MPLRPEMRQYARREGIDPAHFAHEITTLKKQQKLERKAQRRSPLQRSLDAVDTVSRKSVNGFFEGLTAIRTHTPGAVKLFPWEKWYFDEYPDAGDPKKRKTWKELQEEKIDERKMFVLYLQDRYVVSEKTLLSLADQATTKHTRDSWLFFNKRTQRVLNHWIDHEWPAAISQGVAKGLISVVPQHPDLDGLFFLGGGAAASKVGTDQDATRSKVNNTIHRMGDEFSLLLRFHYLSLQRSLAGFKDFSSDEVNGIGQRMFQGSRYDIESTMAKREAKGIIAGVAVAQAAQDSASGSLSSALINLIGPTLAAAYLYRKMRKERSGPAVQRYIETQRRIHEKVDLISKSASSHRGRGISIDLEATGIPQDNDELADEMVENRKRVYGPLEQTPIFLAAGTQAFNEFHLGQSHQFAPGASSLVTGSMIVLALSKLIDETTRQRNAEVKNRENKRIKRMITAVDTSGHKVPRYIDLADAGDMLSFETARTQMKGPLVIEQLDSGSEKISISVEEPLTLPPGISIVRAPVGGGKSSLLRMLALEQGNLPGTQVKKGIDFRSIDPGALSELVYYVEASYPPSNFTIAEQMIPFIIDKDTTFYESIMNQQFVEPDWLHRKYSREKLDQFYATFTQRPDLLLGWVDNPRGDPNNPDSEIASTLLTHAFFYQVQHKFVGIKTVDDAAEYLLRKPGALQGTSTGEAQKLEILKAFMKKGRKVILLDEPTANLEGEQFNEDRIPRSLRENHITMSSVNMVIDSIRAYLRHSPDTVIVIASNDSRLDFFLKLYQPQQLRQEVTRKYMSDFDNRDKRFVWQAKPIENDVFKRHIEDS